MNLAKKTIGPRIWGRCDICGKKFKIFLRMFIPDTMEEVWVCGGKCSTDIKLAHREICLPCVDYSNFSSADPQEPSDFGHCEECKWL